jgi:hypothetical protein
VSGSRAAPSGKKTAARLDAHPADIYGWHLLLPIGSYFGKTHTSTRFERIKNLLHPDYFWTFFVFLVLKATFFYFLE